MVIQKTFLNAFYRVLIESALVLAVSGASLTLPQLFPDYPRRAVLLVLCLALACQIMPGGVASWAPGGGLFLIGWQFPRWDESTKKMYDKSEIASKPTRFEPEKSEKNRRNLRLIQTCDFFILCILHIIFYNVPRRDVNFYLITFNSSFLVVFFLLVISEILLLRFFCRLVSLLLRFADSLLTVPMPTPF